MRKKNAAEIEEGKKVKKKLSKKAKRRIVIFTVAGAVIISVMVHGQIQARQPVPAETTQVLTGDLEQTLNTSGTVESEQTKTYYSPVGATIQDVPVELGDAVTAGQLLVAYDVNDLKNAKEQAQYRTQAAVNSYLGSAAQNTQSGGKYAEASTNLDVLEQQISDQKNLVSLLKDQLEDKTNEKKNVYQKKDVELQKKLLTEQANLSSATGADAQEEINWRIRNIQSDIAQNNYDLSMADQDAELKQMSKAVEDAQDVLNKYEEARTEMKSQKSGNEASQSSGYNAASLNASARETKLSQEIAEENLELAQNGVTADFAGIITSLPAKAGALTTQGMELMEVQSNKEVCVKVELTKYDLEKVAVGQKADVTIAGRTYEGEISRIYHMATKNASGSSVVQALIHIDNPDDGIFLGIEAKVVIHIAESHDALLIPVEVINADTKGSFVYVVENGVVTRKDIVTGISSDTYTEVLDGLLAGDAVIVDSSTVEEGMNVTAYDSTAQQQ